MSHASGSQGGGDVASLPEGATPEQKDLHWYRHVYQGDRMPQLTWRAVLMGGFLGMAMAAANLYTTLAIGWAFGIAITACVLSFVIWSFVRFASGKGVSQMSVLENACMASTASAAGYSTGSTIATMFGALVLLKDPGPGQTLADIKTLEVTGPMVVTIFTLCTGLMGVFLAIPMKRQMINHEQLPFPSGTAAAETLRSLYSQSADAVRKAYVLVAGLGFGLLVGLLRAGDEVLAKVGFLRKFFDFFHNKIRVPAEIELHAIDSRYPGGRHPAGFSFDPSALLIAAGMIVGLRISTSMLVGSLLLYVVVAPPLAKMDADRFEKPAMLVLEKIGAVGESAQDPEAAAAAVLEAARAGAVEAGLAPERIVEAARAASDRVVADAKAELARMRAEGKGEAEIGEFERARARAVVAAAKGKWPEAVVEEACAARVGEGENYKPSFIWHWGGKAITITRWSLWGGTALMVFSSLMSVALQWKTLVRAFTGVRGGEGASESAAMAGIEVPGRWMVYGMVPITIAMVWLQIQAFQVSWYAGVIAVGMSFVLSLVASRATGETDTTPIGAMGKVMQLLFAVLAPNNINANLASAGIAANSASSSADLLTDLKTGYLLGANPRKQFIAQFLGVFFGTVAIVPIWYLMVPDREKLETFAMPATRSWEAVARVLVKGIEELPPSAMTAILVGAILGCVLPIIERLLPARARRFMPSATGLGLAWVIPFSNAFSFFIGAVIAEVWLRVHKRSQERYNVPLASGLVAGESLMAAALAISATVADLLSK